MTCTDHFAWWRERAGAHPLLTAEQELVFGRQIQAWQADGDGVDPRIKRRGMRARDRLVAANLRLVITVARRHQRHTTAGCGLEDLIQGGNLGLMRAAEKFDPARGYKFSTYAYWWINQGVRDTIQKDAAAIRMPTTFAGRMVAIAATAQALVAKLGREPSHDELATALDITPHALNTLLVLGRCASLDRMIGDGSDDTFLDALAAPADPDEEDEQLLDLRSRLQGLPPYLARLLEARYQQRRPAAEIAAEENLTAAELRKRMKYAIGMLAIVHGRAPLPSLMADMITGDQLALFQAEAKQQPHNANRKGLGMVRHRPTSARIQYAQCALQLA